MSLESSNFAVKNAETINEQAALENKVPEELKTELTKHPRFRKLIYAFLTSTILLTTGIKSEAQKSSYLFSDTKKLEMRRSNEQLSKEVDSLFQEMLKSGAFEQGISDPREYKAKTPKKLSIRFTDTDNDKHFSKGDSFDYMSWTENGSMKIISINKEGETRAADFNMRNPHQSGIEGAEIVTLGQLTSETGIIYETGDGDINMPVARKVLTHQDQVKILNDVITTLYK